MISRLVIWTTAAVLGLVSSAAAGPIWCESFGPFDAGPTTGTAQETQGVGPLGGIDGELNGPGDLEDVYEITIPAGTTLFRAHTDVAGIAGFLSTFDTQLFLFDVNGFGVLANNDQTGTGKLGSEIVLTGPPSGTYYLAISGFGRDPVSAGGLIFQIVGDEISPPDGPGGALPLLDWAGDGEQFGTYFITLEGAEFADVPAPGAALMLAGLLVARRRR